MIAAQALLVALLPSNAGKTDQVAATAGLSNGQAAASGDAAAATDGATGATDAATGADGGAAGAVNNAAGSTKSTVTAAASTAHCKGNKQFAILSNANPPCVPKSGGKNAGATYQGVTDKKIKIVFFSSVPNEQVDAILGTQGLAVPYDESVAYDNLALDFVEKHYELYGRTFDRNFYIGNCPTTPPDYQTCNAEAKAVIEKYHPFLIIWGTPLYGSVFDIWSNSKVVSFGGWQFDDSLFNNRRPYRYDPWMNGTEVGKHLAEYYCKKMAKGNADHSGAVIHATIGGRGNVPRKLGIITPGIEANTLAANRVIAAVRACGGNVTGTPYTYESNINTAPQQTQATVQKLIADKVTTVACMCDPIAPAFLTKGMTSNTFFPEFLLTGTQFLDADLVGRLYDQGQMKHAFGISTIPQQVPLDQADSARVWQDMGKSGHPCEKNGCGINWSYVQMLGTAIQMAGPKLDPLTLEKGMLTMPSDGGWIVAHKPDVGFWMLGANDYTWLSDVREVYWSSTAISPVDNSSGAYVGVNGGQRYKLGQWGPGLNQIPVEPN
ncbi:MAG TPA: hypothetical protein VFB78_09025 [Acidimicrobiales bacterium]|nr:hypothetical protein [Acidimicrobiales bacterium]